MKNILIVFENEHFLVAHKPAGTLSVPSRLGSREPRAVLKNILEEQVKCKLWAVHRLDYEVGGLIVYAKSQDSHRQGNKWFEDQTVKKTYSALTEGTASMAEEFKQESEWKSFLFRGKKRTFEAPYGQRAITFAQFQKCTDCNGQTALEWILHPQTGRSHQLRYELSKRKFPILGDILYGATADYKKDAIALESLELNFSKCPDREKFGLPEMITIKSSWSATPT